MGKAGLKPVSFGNREANNSIAGACGGAVLTYPRKN